MPYPHTTTKITLTTTTIHAQRNDCNTKKDIEVPTEAYLAYLSGKHAQDAFPTLTADQREILISGLCGKCFDAAFAASSDPINPDNLDPPSPSLYYYIVLHKTLSDKTYYLGEVVDNKPSWTVMRHCGMQLTANNAIKLFMDLDDNLDSDETISFEQV